MDVVSPEVRSRIMSRIRGKDTAPERVVRSYLHRRGVRFRLTRRGLPGTPDIVLPRYRTVIFVHGCFWHQHPGCQHYGVPKTRQEYWRAKFDRTAERDARKVRELCSLGWKVQIIWECEVCEPHLAALVASLEP